MLRDTCKQAIAPWAKWHFTFEGFVKLTNGLSSRKPAPASNRAFLLLSVMLLTFFSLQVSFFARWLQQRARRGRRSPSYSIGKKTLHASHYSATLCRFAFLTLEAFYLQPSAWTSEGFFPGGEK